MVTSESRTVLFLSRNHCGQTMLTLSGHGLVYGFYSLTSDRNPVVMGCSTPGHKEMQAPTHRCLQGPRFRYRARVRVLVAHWHPHHMRRTVTLRCMLVQHLHKDEVEHDGSRLEPFAALLCGICPSPCMERMPCVSARLDLKYQYTQDIVDR